VQNRVAREGSKPEWRNNERNNESRERRDVPWYMSVIRIFQNDNRTKKK
jgi:hypothetical protein